MVDVHKLQVLLLLFTMNEFCVVDSTLFDTTQLFVSKFNKMAQANFPRV